MVDKSFWRGKKVLVTGHTGFKGSWLSLWLHSLQAEVYGYALEMPKTPNMFAECHLEDILHNQYGDIRNQESVSAYMRKCEPEIIFHLAAQPLVRESYRYPLETYATNVMGTVNILEAARKCPSVKSIVIITTDKCYENKEWIWGYRESDPLGGYDPYASSKACAELVAQSYRLSFFQENKIFLATARAGNVIGGGDWAKDRLIPDCIRAIQNHREIILRNPEAIRPWQFVLEPLKGYLMLAEKLYMEGTPWAEAWNFGPERSAQRMVEEVVKLVCDFTGGKYKVEVKDNLHENRNLELDISKASSILHWEPSLELEQAVKMTVAWYNAWIEQKTDMREISLQQINEFQGV
ncbi:CDP-glucose 4,6-dehydratase [Propionispira raffinosivorans]|uniref:CDP-glucose 4,6-dehydratase n=1 Tax=Propionispira raffinosivorans TaxID=86959 RepID=UPI0003A63DEC|nr:CDP-glucose 4,6-dehydratase [Propionispira raffinosivorans]